MLTAHLRSDSPTVTPVPQIASIELVKEADESVLQGAVAVGTNLPYSFTVTNTGNVTLTNIVVTDLLPGVVVNGNPIASLAPGAVDSTSITATYPLSQNDIDTGEVINTATVTGTYTDATGTTQNVTDDSSDTVNFDTIEALPEPYPPFTTDGGVTTSVLDSDTVQGQPATLTNVTITVLDEDPGVTLNPADGLITLEPGRPAGEYTVTYRICSIQNPSVCAETTETVVQGPRPSIETVKAQALIDNGDGIDGVDDRVVYTITVRNTGNVEVDNLTLVDTFTARDGTGLSLDFGPNFVSSDLGSAEGLLQIGETATYTAGFRLTVDTVMRGGINNTVTATAMPIYLPGVPGTPAPVSDMSDDDDDADGNTTNDPTTLVLSPVMAPAGLEIKKTTPRGVVERGSIVPYTITVRNVGPVVAGPLNVVDVLPQGLLYNPGSATLSGAPFAVQVEGRTVTWPGLTVPPLATITLTLSARVTTGAASGELVNTASLRNPVTGALLAEEATATVRIMPEPVFDCGDVIGKVYDDKNRDGYQNKGEKGIPAARVVGVDGTIITTDEHGRFHVPCAMLPRDRGSNFILKLDTRSLPTGYRLVTENPRVVRLTPGKLTRLNFGVALTSVVRIDLNDRAFVAGKGGKAVLSPQLVAGIDKLLPRIADRPVNLRLAYHVPYNATAQDVKRGRALMRLVRRHIKRKWRNVGRVKLTIEQTIVRREKR